MIFMRLHVANSGRPAGGCGFPQSNTILDIVNIYIELAITSRSSDACEYSFDSIKLSFLDVVPGRSPLTHIASATRKNTMVTSGVIYVLHSNHRRVNVLVVHHTMNTSIDTLTWTIDNTSFSKIRQNQRWNMCFAYTGL